MEGDNGEHWSREVGPGLVFTPNIIFLLSSVLICRGRSTGKALVMERWHKSFHCPSGQQGENRITLVFFLGGVTYAEIAALRFLSQMEDGGMEYVIATTKLINGTTWIKSLMDKPKPKTPWVSCSKTWQHQARESSNNINLSLCEKHRCLNTGMMRLLTLRFSLLYKCRFRERTCKLKKNLKK